MATKKKITEVDIDITDEAPAVEINSYNAETQVFTINGKQYKVNAAIPAFKHNKKMYVTEELGSKLKVADELVEMGAAVLVEHK